MDEPMTDRIDDALGEYLAAYAAYKPALSRLTVAKEQLRVWYLDAYRSGVPIDELNRRISSTKWETRDSFERATHFYRDEHHRALKLLREKQPAPSG